MPSGVQTCALDRKSTRLNSSHGSISYAVFCLKKKNYAPGRPLQTAVAAASVLVTTQSTHAVRATSRATTRTVAVECARPATSFFFFFNDTATTEIYTLSLHDALPI